MWRCGAFLNDPWLIARLFVTVLGEIRREIECRPMLFAAWCQEVHFALPFFTGSGLDNPEAFRLCAMRLAAAPGQELHHYNLDDYQNEDELDHMVYDNDDPFAGFRDDVDIPGGSQPAEDDPTKRDIQAQKFVLPDAASRPVPWAPTLQPADATGGSPPAEAESKRSVYLKPAQDYRQAASAAASSTDPAPASEVQ